MKDEKCDNIISEILEKIQEEVNGEVGIIREVSAYSFELVLKISIDDKRLDINLPYSFVEDIYYYGNSVLLNTTELALAMLYEIRRSNPDYLKPNYKHPSDDNEHRSSCNTLL